MGTLLVLDKGTEKKRYTIIILGDINIDVAVLMVGVVVGVFDIDCV